jgi:hypothetical protein
MLVSFVLILLIGIVLPSSAQLVQVGPLDPNYCRREKITPNLSLSRAIEISGQIRLPNEEPLAHSKVALRHFVSDVVQPPVTTVETDSKGHFSLGPVQPGKYRLLASPARWAAQPEKLDYPAAGECHLDIVLKLNSTDLPFSQCPIR